MSNDAEEVPHWRQGLEPGYYLAVLDENGHITRYVMRIFDVDKPYHLYAEFFNATTGRGVFDTCSYSIPLSWMGWSVYPLADPQHIAIAARCKMGVI